MDSGRGKYVIGGYGHVAWTRLSPSCSAPSSCSPCFLFLREGKGLTAQRVEGYIYFLYCCPSPPPPPIFFPVVFFFFVMK